MVSMGPLTNLAQSACDSSLGETPCKMSKSPGFSPAQLWRAETRLIPNKAAASEEARRTLQYVEPLSAARTMLVGFFSILLEISTALDRLQ